jgi:small ligand-binding sensory domain FIST
MDAITGTGAFRVAHATAGDWQDMTEACLRQLGAPAAERNLGFVYVTDSVDEDLQPIVARLREATGIGSWVGTVGFGVCVPGEELFDLPAMAVMVGSLPPEDFRVLPLVADAAAPLDDALLRWAKESRPTLGVVHADPRHPALEPVFDAIQRETGCFLVGGLTASRGAIGQIANQAVEGGVSGLLLGGNVEVVCGLTQGCAPIGPAHDVTAARGNILIALDGRPALDVFREDIGELLARNLDRVQGYVHAAVPVTGADTGDYLVRNLLGVNAEQGWVAIGERAEEIDRVMFVRRDGASAADDLKRMIDDVMRRAGRTPRAALYFSCIARGPSLFGRGSVELKAIARALGETPLVGFFANGEICNNRLYGYTGVLALIL